MVTSPTTSIVVDVNLLQLVMANPELLTMAMAAKVSSPSSSILARVLDFFTKLDVCKKSSEIDGKESPNKSSSILICHNINIICKRMKSKECLLSTKRYNVFTAYRSGKVVSSLHLCTTPQSLTIIWLRAASQTCGIHIT